MAWLTFERCFRPLTIVSILFMAVPSISFSIEEFSSRPIIYRSCFRQRISSCEKSRGFESSVFPARSHSRSHEIDSKDLYKKTEQVNHIINQENSLIFFQKKKRRINFSLLRHRSARASFLTLLWSSVLLLPRAACATISSPSLPTSIFFSTNYVIAAVMAVSAAGIIIEQETVIGKAMSAPLVTMAISLVIANLGLIPFESNVYGFVNRNLLPLAVPLLLFDSDLRRVINSTGSLLTAFIVGSLGTIVGTIATFIFVPLASLGSVGDGWKVASALTARHIGGAINFVAVAETLGISSSSVSAAIAADNLVIALYFAFLFTISRAGETGQLLSSEFSQESFTGADTDVVSAKSLISSKDDESSSLSTNAEKDIDLTKLSLSFAVATVLVCVGENLTKKFLPKGISSIPLTSLLTVFMATILPNVFGNLASTGASLGILIMQAFFAASGAAGSIRLVITSAPLLFLFSGLQIGVHFVFLYVVGKYLLKLKENELYLASNANVGGPTTAAAMAQAKEWQSLVLPALLVGILGYSVGTVIALLLSKVLKILPVVSFT